MVPLRTSLAPVFRRKAAVSRMPAEGLHRRAMDGEHVSMGGEPLGFFPILLFVILGVAVIQDLHLNSAQEGHAGSRDRSPPDEDAGVAAATQMAPLNFQDEILVLPRGAQC